MTPAISSVVVRAAAGKLPPDSVWSNGRGPTLKILSWNIQQGGGKRIPDILAAIRKHQPDGIVLTEYRTRPGLAICLALRKAAGSIKNSRIPSAAETASVCSRGHPYRSPFQGPL